MRSPQFTVDEILAALRRRRQLFIAPLILVTAVFTLGAFLLPRKYESSATILVQKDEVLNPLVSFTMAVAMASDDRLQSLNEIILSEPAVRMLIDSLGIGGPGPVDTQQVGKKIRKNIETARRGTDSFTLTYTDTDPYRAEKAVSLLVHYFIRMRLQVENARNELAVEFFEKKLDELRQKYETSQADLITTVKERVQQMPVGSRELYSRVDDVDKSVGAIDSRISSYEQVLAVLRKFPAAFRTDAGKQQLFQLQRADVPFAAELGSVLTQYDNASRHYTEEYPTVQKLEKQILEVIGRMRTALDGELAKQQEQRWQLEKERNQDVSDIQQSSVAAKVDEAQQANYNLYQKLYDDMKVKLEQARITRDLGEKGAQQFIIIDPPQVPTEPSKPKRPALILGGVGLGLLLGAISAALGELLDTRVKTVKDVAVYRLPIVAYVPDGDAGGRN